MKSISVVLLILILGISTCFSQGFTPPEDGKAVVYFARLSPMGSAVKFNLFHNENYIGKIKTSKYVRYECESGENLFWASAENKAFLTANLKSGETYFVLVNTKMGAMSAGVGLTPISEEVNNKGRVSQIIKLVLRQAPYVTPQKEYDKKLQKLKKRDFIKESMAWYETNWKGEKKLQRIEEDMLIPRDLLKK